MRRFVGYDRNNKPLYLGDKVIIYDDYVENQKYGEGVITTYNGGWIYIKLDSKFEPYFPYTKQLTLDMGQMGIYALNFEYEKVED